MTTPHDDTVGKDFIPPNPYEEEAKQRWGHTDAYKESQKRVAKMSKADFERISQEGDVLMKKIAAVADKDPADPDVQALIAQHYAGLRAFYEPNKEMYRGLGDMYAADERFGQYFNKYRPGLALFMRDAMHVFCNA